MSRVEIGRIAKNRGTSMVLSVGRIWRLHSRMDYPMWSLISDSNCQGSFRNLFTTMSRLLRLETLHTSQHGRDGIWLTLQAWRLHSRNQPRRRAIRARLIANLQSPFARERERFEMMKILNDERVEYSKGKKLDFELLLNRIGSVFKPIEDESRKMSPYK